LVLLVPANFRTIQNDWRVTQSYPVFEGLIALPAYAYYVLILRYLAAGALLVTAAILLWIKPRRGMQLLTAVMLASFTLTFNLGGNANNWPYPAPWSQILVFLSMALLITGFFLFLLFILLFPSGHLAPRWVTRIAPVTLSLLGLGIVLLFTGIGGDWAWVVMAVLLFANLLLCLTSLILRYRQIQDKEERLTIRPVLIGLLFLASLFIAQIFVNEWSGTSPALTVAYLHLEFIAILMLPLSILASISRHHQLWGIDLQPQRRSVLGVIGGVLAILVLSGFAFFRVDEVKQARIQADIAALLEKPNGPLIVDTDMGNDDVLALIFLMQHPGVELQAVTVVGTGLVHCAPGIRNVQGLLELTQYADIPVSCGTEEPLDGEHPFPQAWRSAADRLWGLNLPTNNRQPSPLPAPDLIVESLAEADQPVTILALGPLTNLAQAFQSDPEVINKIEQLYLMGGAVEAPGNVYDPNLGFDNRTAEWNIYADPLAARIVFESGVPITMVPLDATNYVPVSMPFFQRLQQHHPTRAGTFTFNLFYINQGWIQSGGYYLWDTLAAAVLTANEVAEYKDYQLEVITERGPDFGRTKPSPEGTPVRVATWADAPLFEELFLRVINRE
jgi:pyrimidine-specific ribonucleoside hydrolase